ncbi:MAG: integrin alpha [Pseudomonadota bacterium]
MALSACWEFSSPSEQPPRFRPAGGSTNNVTSLGFEGTAINVTRYDFTVVGGEVFNVDLFVYDRNLSPGCEEGGFTVSLDAGSATSIYDAFISECRVEPDTGVFLTIAFSILEPIVFIPGTDLFFELTVTVSDGTFENTVPVGLTIVDNVVEPQAPTLSGTFSQTYAEGMAIVFDGTLNDANASDTLTLTMTGADSDDFWFYVPPGGANPSQFDRSLTGLSAAQPIEFLILAPQVVTDFENPSDANGDGVYELAITASDGDLSVTQNVAATISDIMTNAFDESGAVVITGIQEGAQFGASLAANADLDDDLTPDFVVGARGDNPDGTERIPEEERDESEGFALTDGEVYNAQGATYVFSSEDVLATDTPRIDLATQLSPDLAIRGLGEDLGDYLGEYVGSTDDLDGDGIREILASAPRKSAILPSVPSVEPNEQAGATYLIPGSVWADAKTNGTQAVDLQTTVDNAISIVFGGEQTEEQLGTGAVDAGDVDNDGLGDIVICAPRYDDADVPSDAGVAHVVLGAAAQFALSVGNTDREILLNLDAPDGTQVVVLRGAYEQSNLCTEGAVASAGDIDGDFLDDLIIGARQVDAGPGNSLPNGTSQDEVYVVFGSAIADEATGDGIIDLADLETEGDGFILLGDDLLEEFGEPGVAGVGDLDGDGHSDIAIGSISYTHPDAINGAPADDLPDGAVLVIFGDPNIAATLDTFTSLDDLIESDTATLFFDDTPYVMPDNFDEYLPSAFGYRVRPAGDVNNQGPDDLLITAPFMSYGADNDTAAGFLQGGGFVIFGSSTLPGLDVVNITELENTDPAAVIEGVRIVGRSGPSLSTLFGFASIILDAGETLGIDAASLGDLNGDGNVDIGLSTPFAISAGAGVDAGSVYVVSGSALTTEAAGDGVFRLGDVFSFEDEFGGFPVLGD